MHGFIILLIYLICGFCYVVWFISLGGETDDLMLAMIYLLWPIMFVVTCFSMLLKSAKRIGLKHKERINHDLSE